MTPRRRLGPRGSARRVEDGRRAGRLSSARGGRPRRDGLPPDLDALAATAALVGAAYVIVAPFLVSIGWAAILAYATWPVYRRLLAGVGGRAGLAAFVVSGVDNVLRPYLIGGATQAPFLLVFFGVLDGLARFGLIGLFIGPIVLAVLLAVWRDWAVVPATAKSRPEQVN